jgi:endoglucanase
MKKYILTFTFFIILFLQFFSCKGSNIEDVLNILSVSQNNYSFGENGGTNSFIITSNTNWEISSNSLWCVPSIKAGNGDATIELKVSTNHYNERNCIITIKGKSAPEININVSQNSFNYYVLPENTRMNPQLSAIEFSKLLGLGWNVGNSLEAINVNNGVYSGDETLWGNPKITKRLIDSVKHAGFNTIRIPVAWSHRISDETTNEISEAWKLRVSEVVNYVLDNDMYAIINIHWDGGWMNSPTNNDKDRINKKIKDIWTQLAIYFRDYNDHLIFAGTNEVHVGDYWGDPNPENLAVQKTFNQTFVDAVRATGGKNTYRFLVIQAYNTNITLANNHLTMPTDSTPDRLMAEVHFYDPYEFCLKTDSPFVSVWSNSTWGKEDWVNTSFGNMKTKFISKGIPVILGEYGVIKRSSLTGTDLTNHMASRNYYLEYVTSKAVDNGIIPVYWDNGQNWNNGFALFNRSTGAVVDKEALQSIVNGGRKKK